jgi:hypothetical protein
MGPSATLREISAQAGADPALLEDLTDVRGALVDQR